MQKKIMKVLVINGSPKGKNSVTLQTVLYLQKVFPNDSFTFVEAAQKIRKYEKDFSAVKEAVSDCDLILFSYPVYTFLVPYQLHRFIEFMKENQIDIGGKYAAQISTSKHFYDVTANKFIEENCQDMKLKYIGALSADMDDLLKEKGQKEAEDFWKYVRFCRENDIYVKPLNLTKKASAKYERQLTDSAEKKTDKLVTVVTNCKDDESLSNMIDDFVSVLPYSSKVININSFRFDGGCLGCLNCASTGKCVWKDGFEDVLRGEIQSSDAIVYAFTIDCHSMGSSLKLYDDRQFCNGHRTVTVGTPAGYIVNGDLDCEPNLRMVLEARCNCGENPLAYIAHDTQNMKVEIETLSKKLTFMLEENIAPIKNFYGVGGMKIFRDLIFTMQGFMKEDHRFYKKHGMYDFPQKKLGTIIGMKALGLAMSVPKIQKEAKAQMSKAMVMPYQKVIDKASSKESK